MKKPSFFRTILVMLLLSLLYSPVHASVSASFQSDSANTLSKLGVINTSEASAKKLKLKIKKHEYISLIVKMHCLDTDTDLESTVLPYKDVDKSHKSYNNIKIAYKYGIISETPNNTLSPNSYLKYSEALEMIICSLGYREQIRDLKPEEILEKASELGLCNDIELPSGKQITFGEAYAVAYNALTIDYNK